MRHTLLLLAVIGILWGLGVSEAYADPYCNSSVSEPAINAACLAGTATGPNGGTILLADDFEDGEWAQTDCDGFRGLLPLVLGNTGAINYAPNDGWCMNVFYPLPQNTGFPSSIVGSPNFGLCGGVGAAGTPCTARSGPYPGGNNSAMQGEHNLKVKQPSDVYIRWYHKFVGSHYSDLKWLTLNVFAGSGGIYHGTMLSKTQSGSTAEFAWTPSGPGVPDIGRLTQNLGNALVMVPGRWYYVEVHLHAQPGGIYELWTDDCGTTGTSCTGPGTLRARYTGITTKGSSGDFGDIWIEMNGKDDQPVGSEFFTDQIVVSTARIGPVNVGSGDTTPPASPTGLFVR